MTIEDFRTICNAYGDQSLPENERWKSIKMLSVEGQMQGTDFGYYYDNNLGYFLDVDGFPPVFVILESPYAEFEPFNYKDKIVTIITLTMVNALGFKTPKSTTTTQQEDKPVTTLEFTDDMVNDNLFDPVVSSNEISDAELSEDISGGEIDG